eukprot:g29723.t1
MEPPTVYMCKGTRATRKTATKKTSTAPTTHHPKLPTRLPTTSFLPPLLLAPPAPAFFQISTQISEFLGYCLFFAFSSDNVLASDIMACGMGKRFARLPGPRTGLCRGFVPCQFRSVSSLSQYSHLSRAQTRLSPNFLAHHLAAASSQRWFSSGEDVAIIVPSLGDSITEGTITAILKSVGDAVEVEEVVFSVETDKVSIDIRSDYSGAVTGILVKEGDDVPVGAKLMTIAVGAGSATAKTVPSAAAQKAPSATAPSTASAAPAASPAAAAQSPPPRPQEPAKQPAAHARVPSIRFRYGRLNAKRAQAQAAPKPEPVDHSKPGPAIQSRVLSEREIEFINLGGAEPY